MQISLSYILEIEEKKRDRLLDFAMKDEFFKGIIHDLIDYGYKIKFSILGGAGAYKPFALSSEKLDTPQKQQQFTHGFWKMSEAGNMKAKIQLSLLLGAGGNAHSFLHEILHFYQDMYGLYFLPLKEQRVFPTSLDANGNIVSILFCEAWAEIETIRTCWSLAQKGDDLGWVGAINSPDWKDLAKSYDYDLQNGVDEAKAAANAFRSWYKSKQRSFYETQALKIYEINFARYVDDVKDISDAQISDNLRSLELADILARIPQNHIPKFFTQIDLGDELFSKPVSANVIKSINEIEKKYGAEHSGNIQDIRCGSPPYIWKRLRNAEVEASEVPPH